MRTWSSPLSKRLAIVRDVRRRGDTGLFCKSFCVALTAPLLLKLPLSRLEALLEWAVAREPRRGPVDPRMIAATVLDMLQAGRPLVRRGCLTRGFTLYYFLRRSGVDVSLTFGMGKVERGDGFEGHCWLVLDGEPFLEPRDPRGDYAAIYSFSPDRGAHDWQSAD